jgi:hypothetical protein
MQMLEVNPAFLVEPGEETALLPPRPTGRTSTKSHFKPDEK